MDDTNVKGSVSFAATQPRRPIERIEVIGLVFLSLGLLTLFLIPGACRVPSIWF